MRVAQARTRQPQSTIRRSSLCHLRGANSTESEAPAVSNTWAEWLSQQKASWIYDITEEKDHHFKHLPWAPRLVDRRAAWELYTELRTRITTQPLSRRADSWSRIGSSPPVRHAGLKTRAPSKRFLLISSKHWFQAGFYFSSGWRERHSVTASRNSVGRASRINRRVARQ